MPQSDKDIYYYDRASGRLERETVYGERFVKWAYQEGGKPLLHRLLFTSPLPSRLLGHYFNSRFSRHRIRPAIDLLKIDTSEFRDPVESFSSFNHFFTRHLKPEARPFDHAPDVLVSPADGRTLVFPCVDGDTAVPVKGKSFSVQELLQRDAPDFRGGVVIVIRLCPADYHRYHFPCAGTVTDQYDIPGAYHSVNPVALAAGFDVFTENRRACCLLETAQFGSIAFIEVGAFGVAGIVQTYAGTKVSKMDEKGYFTFGGSTIILAIQAGRIVPSADLLAQSANGRETLVKVGETIGRAVNPHA